MFPDRHLNRPAAKWNSHLAQGLDALETAPTHRHWGSNGTWVGLIRAGLAGAMGIEPCPPISFQPRLACETCLTASFGTPCVFSMPMCLWWR